MAIPGPSQTCSLYQSLKLRSASSTSILPAEPTTSTRMSRYWKRQYRNWPGAPRYASRKKNLPGRSLFSIGRLGLLGLMVLKSSRRAAAQMFWCIGCHRARHQMLKLHKRLLPGPQRSSHWQTTFAPATRRKQDTIRSSAGMIASPNGCRNALPGNRPQSISALGYDLVFPDIPLAMQKDGQAKLSLAMPSPEEATRPEMDFGEIENAAELGFEKVEDVAYPQMARIAHIEGDVRIDLGIDVPSGKVVSTTPVSGHPLLQRAVADAATQWAFSHPYFGPNPLPVMVHFKLRCPLIVETSQSVIAASKKNKPRSHNEWPPIRPVEVSRTLNNKTTIADTPFFLSIKDVHRVTIYRLECHNGNYENGSKINFSGDFQCALFAIKNGSRVSGNLLATNTKDELSTEWWNRGRTRSAQLRGKCLDYPDYSTDRIFKLRGMRLTLRFTKMKWGRNKSREHGPVLTGFTFTFKAVPDESAHTANADVVGAPAPPASCYP